MQISRRRALYGIAAAASTIASGLPACARTEAGKRQVMAFYYGWYATPAVSGRQLHWPIRDGQPSPSPAFDHPLSGPYDSHDQAVIERHARLLKAAGVTVIIVSWWGIGTFEDESLTRVMDAMHAQGIKVTAYFEPGSETTSRAAATEAMLYLIRRHGSHPAWFKVGDRSALFVYEVSWKRRLAALQWRAAADGVEQAGLPRPLLIGDLNPLYGTFGEIAPAFDGLHTYVMAPYVTGKTPAEITAYTDLNYPKWKAAVGQRIYCATVIPGFDDTLVPGRPLPRPVVARNGTGTFDALWRAAIKTAPDWVLITSFNEWHEGSEIEPSREYGDTFIKRNRFWSDRFLGLSG